MPFWWQRRKKPWYGWRRRWTFNKYKRRGRKRFYRRRRPRPTTRRRRRRRRRRRKVRRKKQTLTLKQWQPDSIRHCKIKGGGAFILGSHGKQYECYSYVKEQYVPPKSPSGGGFTAEQFSLQYLYEEYKFHRNIWTKSNLLTDLCRYLRCSFYFYRHPEIDFVVSYERQPPFPLTKYTYTLMHPQQLLMSRHKKIILSAATKPNGRVKKKLTIKPPKQMLNKWFFTHHFAPYTLLLLKGAAMSLRYSNLGCCNFSQQVNVYYLNLQFWRYTDWGNTTLSQTTPYKPFDNPNLGNITYKKGAQTVTETWTNPTTYNKSVSLDQGWFSIKILNAIKFSTGQASLPVSVGRYNPAADDGTGNKMYLVSIVKKSPIQPQDPILVFEGLPLWLMAYGWLTYVLQMKKDKRFLDTYYIVWESPAIYRYTTTQTTHQLILLDESFMKGLSAYSELPTETEKTAWYPTVKHQIETLNNIVTSGPYIPKLDNQRNSTWELDYFYIFHFKWGGPEITDPTIKDPATFQEYDVPDHMQKTVQISNPSKQIPASYLHPWDQRRGIITQRALKRMCQNIETDTDFSADPEPMPKKKKRITAQMRGPEEETEEIKACLQTLYEDNTCQEQETQDIQLLIQQQQQQQLELKRSLLKLLIDMKEKQKMLQLQTGLME